MSIVQITFDSNVFPIVVNPERYPNEQSLASFQKINLSIKSGNAKGFLAETVFTLEAIKKVDRPEFFNKYSPKIIFQENFVDDGMTMNINVAPDNTSHPGNNDYLALDLNNALELEFKILPSTRLGWIKNPDLKQEWFVQLAGQELILYENKVAEVLQKIEKKSCGSYKLKQIGSQYNSQSWIDGLKKAPDSEDKAIKKAFAEFADGDSIAFHIAYTNQYFCTRDNAGNAGQNSVLSENNRKWLRQDYGVNFISPEDLAQILII